MLPINLNKRKGAIGPKSLRLEVSAQQAPSLLSESQQGCFLTTKLYMRDLIFGMDLIHVTWLKHFKNFLLLIEFIPFIFSKNEKEGRKMMGKEKRE